MMTEHRKETGRRGEDIATAYLRGKGYRIIERNYRCPFGEADIVARDKRVIVFVEVKSRRSDRFGEPQAAVDHHKQRKLSRIALCYLKAKDLLNQDARFDVLSILFTTDGHRIEHITNAFDLVES